MRDSDAIRIAKISARTQLRSQLIGFGTDPLWSSILGFVAVHELRKHDLIGPVADDVLYAGIITINSARTPAIGSAIGSTLGGLTTVAEGAGAGVIAAKLLGGGGGAGAGAAAGAAGGAGAGAAAGAALATVGQAALGVGAVAAGGLVTSKAIEALLPADAKAIWKKEPLWRKALMASPLFPLTIGDYAKKLAAARAPVQLTERAKEILREKRARG